MIKLDALMDRMRAYAGTDVVSDTMLKLIVNRTIQELGLAVDARGEIYSPAPAVPVMRQSGVRWNGSRRKR